jgi:lactobin A/cerein 7B family class IIb bacteriocin
VYSENLSVSEVKANMFDKRTVVELTENEMTEVDGGTLEIAIATAVLGTAVITILISVATVGGGNRAGGDVFAVKAVKQH